MTILWDADQCAACLGVSPATWRTYASRRMAPASVSRGLWDATEVRAWAHPHVEVDPTIPLGTYGAVDGHGRLGVLDHAEDGRIICHECGRGVWHLATHITTHHHMVVDDYRRTHGLPLTLPLVAQPVRERMEGAWEAHAAQHTRVLAEHRDPGRAAEASRGHAPTGVSRPRGVTGRALTPEEVRALETAPDLIAWARIARTLMDDWVSGSTISQATGVRHGTVNARVSRLAPRT